MNLRPKTASSLLIIAAITGLVLAGCAYPNQFKNVSRQSQHAVLVCKPAVLLVAAINSQPRAFGGVGNSFAFRPVPRPLRSFGFWDRTTYPPIEFSALAGCRYTLRHTLSNDVDRIYVWERSPKSA